MPAVSVIVCVYNSARFLPRCLDSLLGQTLQDIEILTIDDGSQDESVDILRRYAALDARVRLVPHEGAHKAQWPDVSGILAATGDYIGYVDADDYARPTMFETLHGAAVAADADMARGGAQLYEVSATAPDVPPVHVGELRFEPKVYDTGIEFLNADFYPAMWLYVMHRRLWAPAMRHFPPSRLIGEDNLAAFLVGYEARRVVSTGAADYCYVERSDSITGTRSLESTLKHIEDRATIVRLLETFVAADGDRARAALDTLRDNNRALVRQYVAGLIAPDERARAEARFSECWDPLRVDRS